MSKNRTEDAGFTLIEALIAMTIFAIGSMMVLPAMFAWANGNTVSAQKDHGSALLDRAAETLAQQDWDTPEWNNTLATTSDINNAVENLLDGPEYTNWKTYDADQGPFRSDAAIDYAVVEINNDVGQAVARVMKARVQWTGPAGKTWQETRIIQNNDAP